MNDIEFRERIVALEEWKRERMNHDELVLKEIKEMRGEINKYKGFIGCVWFVLSCVGVFFSAFKFFHK